MKDKEYLSEEKYKKVNIFLIVIGIILIVVGIVLIFIGVSNINNTSLSQPEFPLLGENATTQERFNSTTVAVFTIFFGACFSMIGIVVLIIPFKRKIIAYQAQQIMPVAQEGIEKLGPSVGKVAGDIAREVKKSEKE
ncbi:MAG TPA: hypothetical protein PKY25_00255 [Bacilli bacterium]|nr:hypothetical protein [Bacilli bacterium]